MSVELTPSALQKIREMRNSQCEKCIVKIGVRGGGCSGLMYEMTFVNSSFDGDKIFNFDDVTVCVDKKSYIFLNGVTLDYEEGLLKSGFIFNNPSSKKTCGCGESFTI